MIFWTTTILLFHFLLSERHSQLLLQRHGSSSTTCSPVIDNNNNNNIDINKSNIGLSRRHSRDQNNMSATLLRPVVICGPSGVGKGTLIEMLMKRFPNDQFGFSVSHTTRKPREGEKDGVHYHFTTVDAIKKEIDAGKFVEYAEVHGNYYGTSIASVESVQKAGKICVLDIDVQGVQNVKKSNLNPIYVFISPPSIEELEKRLRGRGTETEEAIKRRLGNAAKELEYGQAAGNFDRIFVNANLKETFEDMASAFREWYPELDEVAPEDAPNKN